jgi:hypothetical protein
VEKEAGFKFDQERENTPHWFSFTLLLLLFPLFLYSEGNTHTQNNNTGLFFFFLFTMETCASEFVTAVTGHILRVKDAKQPFLLLLSIRLVGSDSRPGNLLILLSRPLYLLSVFFLSSSSSSLLSSSFFFFRTKRGIYFFFRRIKDI